MTLDQPQTIAVTLRSDSQVYFDGVPLEAFQMREGNTYIFDQSDQSNDGLTLKLSESYENAGTNRDNSSNGSYSIEGTPGTAGAKTTVKLGTDQALDNNHN